MNKWWSHKSSALFFKLKHLHSNLLWVINILYGYNKKKIPTTTGSHSDIVENICIDDIKQILYILCKCCILVSDCIICFIIETQNNLYHCETEEKAYFLDVIWWQ